jgi:ATP-binding cassette subfamily B protein
MLRLEWRLALLVLAFAPLPALIARVAAPMQTRRERRLLERWVRIYSRFNEVLAGIVTVKSFTMEEAEKRRFLSEVNSANEVVIKGVGVDSGLGAAQNLVQIAARVSALVAGGALVLGGHMTVGTLVAFLGYVGGLFGPVLGLAGTYKSLRTAQVSAEEVYAILDAHDHLGDAPDAVDVVGLRGEIAWEGVRFGFHPDAPPVLEGVDLRVAAGERVAIVGPSGSGKSTLVSLVQRFHDPTQGTVRVDGIDVRRLRQLSLRRQVGVVFQDSLLFNESVLANIAYGRPTATRAEIEAAARAANAHDFVVRLPQGYDTVVGERGCRLSVGERQRIAIARTLLKDPAILILDEPTSALDAESEALVSEALERVARGRTTLIIAHRLSTVVDADRIVVLERGRIVEEGRHGDLVAAGGTYAGLVARQTRGFFPLAA